MVTFWGNYEGISQHTVFVLLYEDYLLEIAYWQMAYTVIEPF